LGLCKFAPSRESAPLPKHRRDCPGHTARSGGILQISLQGNRLIEEGDISEDYADGNAVTSRLRRRICQTDRWTSGSTVDRAVGDTVTCARVMLFDGHPVEERGSDQVT